MVSKPLGVFLMTLLSAGTLLVLVGVALAARQGPPKEPQPLEPGDKERTHTETITTRTHTYTVRFEGTVDGAMMREPIGYGAFKQTWQPDRFVRLENIGDTDVVNPWILVNGKRNFRTLADTVAEATEGCTTDAEKAQALWEFQKHHRFHACTWDGECNDAVKVHNVYGYTLCGNDSQCISDLWKAAGLTTRRTYPVGHSTAEAYFDGAYHLIDGDEHLICLLRDNETIASAEQVVRDHDLMKRTHSYGILSRQDRARDERSASLYWYEGERKGEKGGHTEHAMHFTLRPGEAIEWRWDHIGKQYSAGIPPDETDKKGNGVGSLGTHWGPNAYANMCNGKMRYAPDLTKPLSRKGIESEENIASLADDGVSPALHPAKAGEPANVTWKIASAYVIVGGKVHLRVKRASAADEMTVSVSHDGEEWESIWTADRTGSYELEIVFDDNLSPRKRPQYAYWLQVAMTAANSEANVGIEGIEFDTDIQMAPLSLPELEVGANQVQYTDDSDGPRAVRVTHNWVERTSMRPSKAPPAPVFPENGATVEGTQFTFKWQTPDDPDGGEIADYHFQLCAREDMRWPLSPNFNTLSSKTFAKGAPERTIPYVGLLNPGQTYYWRVRARDADGVWGPWGERWSFECEAPGVPLDLKASANEAAGTVTISWHPNPKGRPPVQYKVYGSNEKGFTASDAEYVVQMGKGFCNTMEEYNAKSGDEPDCGAVKTPTNLLTPTTDTQLMVVGPDIALPNANKAFYRVVAVDEKGNESGPSDYVAAPRPFFHTKEPAPAKVGQKYEYPAAAIHSIGHLTCKKGYNAAFWDRETLTYSLADGPDWLTVDAETALVTGTPGADDAGAHNVVLRVENDKEQTAEQRFRVTVSR